MLIDVGSNQSGNVKEAVSFQKKKQNCLIIEADIIRNVEEKRKNDNNNMVNDSNNVHDQTDSSNRNMSQKQEEEMKEMRDEVSSMRVELQQLREEMDNLKSTQESCVREGVKESFMSMLSEWNSEVDKHVKLYELTERKKFSRTPINSFCNTIVRHRGVPQDNFVKYLAQQYQRLSEST